MHPPPRRAPLGAAAKLPATLARRGPVVPGDMADGHIDRLPSIRLTIVAA